MNKNWLLFKVYFLAGAFTFSGGLAMLPVIERDLVDKYKLISKEDLYEYSTLSNTFPGVIAVNSACFVGKKVNGVSGMLIAAFGAIFPAFALMLLATVLYQLIPQEGVFLAVLKTVRAASAAFLLNAAFSLAKYNLRDLPSLLIAGACLIFTIFNLVDAPKLIIAAGIIGVWLTYSAKNKNNQKGATK